jgi:hypothetical protein
MRYMYVFNFDGSIDYFRSRIYDQNDLDFLSFFHALMKH